MLLADREYYLAIRSSGKDSTMIRLTVNGKTIMAKLIDSETTRDFISLLPLTLTMNDLCRREKFANLPRTLSSEGKHKHTYAVGEIAYWPPGPDLADFYRHDDESIPDPGIIGIGRIRSGIEALNVRGPVEVTVELIR